MRKDFGVRCPHWRKATNARIMAASDFNEKASRASPPTYGRAVGDLELADDRTQEVSAVQAEHDAAQLWWRLSVTLNPKSEAFSEGSYQARTYISCRPLWPPIHKTTIRKTSIELPLICIFVSIPFHHVRLSD
jgi:hypothetical protein